MSPTEEQLIMFRCITPNRCARQQDAPSVQQQAIAGPSPNSGGQVARHSLLGGLAALSLRSKRQARKKLPRHEVPLAGYLLDKAVIGDPVEQQDIPRLMRANDTVHETRARFPYGRGNVANDIAASNHASSQRAQATLRQGRSLCIALNPYLCTLVRQQKGSRLLKKRTSGPYLCTLLRRASIQCTL